VAEEFDVDTTTEATDGTETVEVSEQVIRKMRVRLRMVKLTKGGYEGWWYEARTNPKLKFFSDVASGDFDRMVGGLSNIIVRWNFVDEEGEPLPQPKDGGVAEMSLDLVNIVASSYVEELGKLPPV